MAVEWEGNLDPSETLDFRMDFYDESLPEIERVLDLGEEIASFEVAPTPEAVLLGLTIRDDGLYAPTLDETATKIILWLEVDPADQGNPDFVDGLVLGVEGTIVTSSTPPRTRQRTFNVTVRQL